MSSTDVRRLILAVDLITVATVMVWVGSMPVSGTGREILLFGALLPLAAAVVLVLQRFLGALLALLGGTLGALSGVGIGVASGFGGAPVHPAVYVLIVMGLGVIVLAVVDLVLLGLSRRS